MSGLTGIKKVLLSLLAVGGLTFLTYGGVFAVMSGDLTNRGSTIASGTLTFSNNVNPSLTVCISNAGPAVPGNVNSTCDALFTSSTLMYPGQLATAKVTIKNTGTLDAKDLSVFMPSCTMTVTPGAPAGGGDPCGVGGAQLYIQETDASWAATQCLWPTTAATCPLIADTLYSFAQNHPDITSVVDLGAGPAAGQSRYFIVGMELPTTSSNTLQGEEAVFGLTWHVTS